MRLILYFLFFISFTKVQSQCKSIQECLIENGKHLLNTPYKGGTLDEGDSEKLISRSDAFDCVTYVEYVMALSLAQCKKNKNFEDYLTQMRYKNGRLIDYASRIHYFTEWVIENSSRGLIKDVTPQLSNTPYKKRINFMSSNINKYPKLKINDNIQAVRLSEKIINRKEWFYIPTYEISKIQNKIMDGDIIAITTNINGLDIVHTGFAIKKENKLHLLHASSDQKKVVITTQPLDEYIKKNKNQNGIIVLRPL